MSTEESADERAAREKIQTLVARGRGRGGGAGFGVGSLRSCFAAPIAGCTRPIVFTNVGVDLIGKGFIRSYANPGGNITGFANSDEELAGKRLELLKKVSPELSRVFIIGSRSHPNWVTQLAKYEDYATRLQLRFTSFDGDNNDELDSAVRSFAQERGGGIDVPASTYAGLNRATIIAIAAKYKLPAVYPFRWYVADGGLMSYTLDSVSQFRGAIRYIDRILRGEKAR